MRPAGAPPMVMSKKTTEGMVMKECLRGNARGQGVTQDVIFGCPCEPWGVPAYVREGVAQSCALRRWYGAAALPR